MTPPMIFVLKESVLGIPADSVVDLSAGRTVRRLTAGEQAYLITHPHLLRPLEEAEAASDASSTPPSRGNLRLVRAGSRSAG
jgi:hypothetical protein